MTNNYNNKTIALLTAAGVGSRMNNNIPKQFLTVENKPIIIYTLEAFENHSSIDEIIVACLKEWIPVLSAYAKESNITKLKYIVPGGDTGQQSITNCLEVLKENGYSDNDIIMVHDGNRPLVLPDVISESIATCINKGNAVACVPCDEVILSSHDQEIADGQYDRDIMKRSQTPHTWTLGKLYGGYKQMISEGKLNIVAPCQLMLELGEKVNLSNGSKFNFKITRQDDLEIFEALVKASNYQKTIPGFQPQLKKDPY